MKGHLTIALHGLLLSHCVHLGVENDATLADQILEEDAHSDCEDGDEESDAVFELEDGELGLGNKAYAYCGRQKTEDNVVLSRPRSKLTRSSIHF